MAEDRDERNRAGGRGGFTSASTLSTGIAIGLVIGAALGITVFDNLAMGIGIGLALGAAIGAGGYGFGSSNRESGSSDTIGRQGADSSPRGGGSDPEDPSPTGRTP